MKTINYWSVLIWVGLAAVVLNLALYRKLLARYEDMRLHVPDNESYLVFQQESLARRLARIDFWGQVFTVVGMLYGVILAAAYLYAVWHNAIVIS